MPPSFPTTLSSALGRKARRKQPYRRDDWDDRRAGELRRPYGRREGAWPAYESDDSRSRYYDAVGEARGGRGERPGSLWPSEFGYPAARGYTPYGDGPRSRDRKSTRLNSSH